MPPMDLSAQGARLLAECQLREDIVFDPDDIREALLAAVRLYNVTDHIDLVFRRLGPNEILPPHVKVETVQGQESVSVLLMDGREEALMAVINSEFNARGPVYQFVCGWLAKAGKVKPKSEENVLASVTPLERRPR